MVRVPQVRGIDTDGACDATLVNLLGFHPWTVPCVITNLMSCFDYFRTTLPYAGTTRAR